MQKGIIVVNGKWGYPKGGVVYRIGLPDSVKGLLCVLGALSEASGSKIRDQKSEIRDQGFE